MLQFFKKSGQKDRLGSSHSSPTKSIGSETSVGDVFTGGTAMQMHLGSLCSLEEEEENEMCGDQRIEITSFCSRLSKTLPEILADKSALGYFIQFMEAKGCIALIKFWLEVECVCGAHDIQESAVNQDELQDDARDRCSSVINSFSNSFDNNDSYKYNLVTSNIDYRDSSQLSQNVHVNSNNVKSNCNDIPKTSQMIKRTCQSNFGSGNKILKSTTTKQDAQRIYKKYIVKDALGINRISDELRTEIEKALLCNNTTTILKSLSIAQKIVYKILEDEYLNEFLRSDFHCKHQIDVLTSGNVQLADILYNETAFFYFMEFMELENKREMLDFWMSVVNYKQNLLEEGDIGDSMEAQTDALIIYDKYFSLQATMPLGFSDRIRFQVEQNICREGGKGPQPDCFDLPCKIVYNFLNKHYLPAFLSSQLYYKYLSELISTIQSSPCLSLYSRIRTGSDCSSEISTISTSTQNTLQTRNEDNKSFNNTLSVNGNMNIDTKQLYDPDSLWRRNKYRLSVGYINDMGRFVTEIEPDPHRKYESRLSRAVKRFINMEQDKAKEEMAWKIAEMIVREITSLTLTASNFSS